MHRPLPAALISFAWSKALAYSGDTNPKSSTQVGGHTSSKVNAIVSIKHALACIISF